MIDLESSCKELFAKINETEVLLNEYKIQVNKLTKNIYNVIYNHLVEYYREHRVVLQLTNIKNGFVYYSYEFPDDTDVICNDKIPLKYCTDKQSVKDYLYSRISRLDKFRCLITRMIQNNKKNLMIFTKKSNNNMVQKVEQT